MREAEEMFRIIVLLAGACLAGMFDGAAAAQRPLAWKLHEETSAWRDRLESNVPARYALIGDSISYRIDSFNWYLRDELEAIYGNGGDGYLALNGSFAFLNNGTRNRRPGLAFRSSNAPWALFGPGNGDRDQYGERSLDGLYARIGASGWVEVDLYGPEVTLHYVREPGAGVIRVELNGDVLTELDASLRPGSTPELGLYSFNTGSGDPNVLSTIRFSLVGATSKNPMWTQLNGLDMRTGTGGVVYHRLARGGSGPDDFLRAMPMIEAATLSTLEPDVVFIMLDQTTSMAQFQIDLPAYVARVQAALPGTPIVLFSHHAFSPSREATTDLQLAIAQAEGHGFLNLFDLHDGFNHLNGLGFLIDSVHFSGTGGDWFGRFVRDALLGWRVPMHEERRFGHHLDGALYETRAIDDQPRRVRSQFGFTALEPNLSEHHFTVQCDAVDVPTIGAEARVRSNTPGTLVTLRLRRLSDGSWVAIDQASIGFDYAVIGAAGIPAGTYVDPVDGTVQLSIRATHVAVFTALGFTLSMDRAVIGQE